MTSPVWIVDIYGFLVAGLLITMGTLGDRIGRRRLLLVGAAAFGLASLFAALSTSAEMRDPGELHDPQLRGRRHRRGRRREPCALSATTVLSRTTRAAAGWAVPTSPGSRIRRATALPPPTPPSTARVA